ncbi:MAG: hypothetical protein ACR2G4_08240 [Pyrinomonadaceae bacterium]
MAVTVGLMLTASASAQSIDLTSPTPVITNEINGRIPALDIGDARLTKYFYTFNSVQGDLELIVESNNLDGDIDIYTAGNLRPLAKVTLYAGTSSSRIAKSVYIRRGEPLLLRVQARTPNDMEGSFRIILGGAFSPAARLATAGGGVDAPPVETAGANASPTASSAGSADRRVKRVSSVGARIEEPPAEVAAKTETVEGETPAIEPAPAAKKSPARTNTRRPRRDTRRGAAKSETAKRDAANTTTNESGEKSESITTKATETESSDSAARNEAATPETPAPTKTTKRARPAAAAVRVPRAKRTRTPSAAKRTDAPPAAADAPAAPTSAAATPAPPVPSARLVLVLRDGETFERDMGSVRRVTVEKGMIVIVSKNGKIERQPMANVLRMSIEP